MHKYQLLKSIVSLGTFFEGESFTQQGGKIFLQMGV